MIGADPRYYLRHKIEAWSGRTWVANHVRGRALPSGHYLAEEAPDETLAEPVAFFRRQGLPGTLRVGRANDRHGPCDRQ